MKNLKFVFLTLAVLFCLASAGSELALNVLTTTSNGDSNSCLLNLTYSIKPNKVVFKVTQYIPDPIYRSCTYQDIVSAPLFYNVPFNSKAVQLTPTAGNPNVLIGEWTVNDMKAALGSSCLYDGLYGQQLYTCRFKWSSIVFYMDFYMVLPLNNTFDTTSTGILFPELVSTKQSTKYGYNIWVPNPSFPHIIGRMEDGCGANNWDNVINSLNTHVTITGTEYLSNTFDLHNYFDGAINYDIIVLKYGSPAAMYKMKQTSFYPFNQPGVDGCTDMGIKYGDFLNDLNYCRNGCAITFILYTNTMQFALTTNGISTAPGYLRA